MYVNFPLQRGLCTIQVCSLGVPTCPGEAIPAGVDLDSPWVSVPHVSDAQRSGGADHTHVRLVYRNRFPVF